MNFITCHCPLPNFPNPEKTYFHTVKLDGKYSKYVITKNGEIYRIETETDEVLNIKRIVHTYLTTLTDVVIFYEKESPDTQYHADFNRGKLKSITLIKYTYDKDINQWIRQS